jgi:hypothetical protein
MWEPGRLTTLWSSTACYRDSFSFYRFYVTTSFPDEIDCHGCNKENCFLKYVYFRPERTYIVNKPPAGAAEQQADTRRMSMVTAPTLLRVNNPFELSP